MFQNGDKLHGRNHRFSKSDSIIFPLPTVGSCCGIRGHLRSVAGPGIKALQHRKCQRVSPTTLHYLKPAAQQRQSGVRGTRTLRDFFACKMPRPVFFFFLFFFPHGRERACRGGGGCGEGRGWWCNYVRKLEVSAVFKGRFVGRGR